MKHQMDNERNIINKLIDQYKDQEENKHDNINDKLFNDRKSE